MATRPVRITADDLLDIPVPDHLLGYELVDGQLIGVMPTSFLHSWMAAEIGRRIGNHIEQVGLGGTAHVDGAFVLGIPHDPDRVRSPDVSYIARDTLARHGGKPARGFARLVPDLAVEIDSPARKPRVERQRIRDYLDAGVRLLWVIHTETRSATVYRGGSVQRLTGGDVLDGEDVLPGFRLALRQLFDPPGGG